MSRAAHVWLRMLAVLMAALAVVLAVDWRDGSGSGEAEDAQGATVLAPAPDVARLRPLFAPGYSSPTGVTSGPPTAADAVPPDLIGIAGRLPDDAEVLVRGPDGGSVTLRIGQSDQGWTLVSVAADRAVFERGGVREVVTIDAGP